jgi:hypothetical protein
MVATRYFKFQLFSHCIGHVNCSRHFITFCIIGRGKKVRIKLSQKSGAEIFVGDD